MEDAEEELNLGIREIYNALMTGGKLRMEFVTPAEAEKFRCKLSNYKSRQDQAMVGIGMLDDDSLQQLSFVCTGCNSKQLKDYAGFTGVLIVATLQLKDKTPLKKYRVQIIED